jgi:DNA polymerase-3 subunit epsilon
MSRGRSPDRQSWREAHFVVVDLETTGLDPTHDDIISFAAIPIQGGRIQPGERVCTLLRPRQTPPAAGVRIHGLRECDLRSQPSLEERIQTISDALAGAILVAHCAWIEQRFLMAALAKHDRDLDGLVIDTMTLGPRVADQRGLHCPDDPSLGVLARALGLPVHRAHHADGDALTTAQVFLALASQLRDDRDATVGELMRARRHRGLSGRLAHAAVHLLR